MSASTSRWPCSPLSWASALPWIDATMSNLERKELLITDPIPRSTTSQSHGSGNVVDPHRKGYRIACHRRLVFHEPATTNVAPRARPGRVVFHDRRILELDSVAAQIIHTFVSRNIGLATRHGPHLHAEPLGRVLAVARGGLMRVPVGIGPRTCGRAGRVPLAFRSVIPRREFECTTPDPPHRRSPTPRQ